MRDGSDYLDPNRPDYVRLSVSEARALGEAALARIGYGEDDARIVTDQLIDNSLCGYRFAGLPRILAIAREAKTKNDRVPVAVVHDTPVSALVDGGNNVGYVAVYRGAEIAIAKAKQSGIAAVGVYNSYFSGRNAYYLERIVDAGFVGLHTASGAPHIVPPGATRPALGANPIAFGFPSADGPVIFDIGTASLMWGEVLLAVEPGKHYRRAWRSTPTGTPTIDDARRQAAVSPLLADIEAMDWLSRSRPWASSPARRSRAASGRITGFCFFVVDFGALLPGNPFAAQISRLVKAIQATPRRPGVEEIHPVAARRPRTRAPPRRRHPRRQCRDRCSRGAMIPRRVT